MDESSGDAHFDSINSAVIEAWRGMCKEGCSLEASLRRVLDMVGLIHNHLTHEMRQLDPPPGPLVALTKEGEG